MCMFNGQPINFDVIDKRGHSLRPNGTIPYNPLCRSLLRIKVSVAQADKRYIKN